jgi:DNA-binding winged helix-turn-helix (wHTH) protein
MGLQIEVSDSMLLVGSWPMSADAWEFDAESLSLRSGARVERVTLRTGDVLACLMRHRGRVVTREQLLGEVWSGVNVTPDLVREYVSDLRALLGDDPHAPRFIETVRGRGYRLIGDIRAASADGTAVPVRIAVLRFGPCRTRVALGVSDEIAVELSRCRGMA